MEISAGLDVGLKRIGVALAFDKIVMPQNAVIRKNRNQAAREISEILQQNGVKKLVVGIPLGGSSEDEMKRRITHFCSLLNFKGEIIFMDESYSIVEADEIRQFSGKKKDGKLDSLAAMVILKRYLGVS